ncbi:uncharacterized protein LOC125075584 [Vanessa atalanta]|uniref:uncharacterized protein LOC125075584 n=1 Tax=Vanessa atalanta TaxID=42275 RepID=UPI001FCDDDF2|nr:uncharacterized protein LOC125075584 [Vanessa atalanta]
MSAEKPSEKETLPAFASRLISSLTNRWKDVNKEEIAVATVLAHLSQFEPRLQRMAFTTNITSREKLQQELSAFSHLKRKINTTSELSNTTDVKRARLTQVQCYNSGKSGHKRVECRSKTIDTRGRPTPTTSSSQASQQPAAKTLVSFKCGKPGHIAARCNSSSHGGSGPAVGGAHGGERRVDVCTVQPPSGTLIHRGELIQFTYDSGAECSLVKESFSSKFSGKRHYNVVAMTGIGKTQAFITEQILCCVTINGHPLEILLHVLPDSYLQSNVMLGREILNRGFAVNMTATELSFTKVCCVYSISQNSDNTLRLDLITTGVSGENKSKLLDVLNQFSEYFITGLPTTRVNTGELKIKLIDSNRTVQRRPYRMSTEERSIVRKRVKELLEANIIRPSCSPFASPALLVKKHDGSDRMCIDYRELNSTTVSDRYPLPLISDQIARLHGANYFSKLDCASGFHLIPVSEDSIEMTAFITNDGQYEFLTMPFGLKNAISVFQRAIMNALGDLAHDYVIVYVDDILIVSPDVELGLQRLYTVLEVLTKAGFSLNLKKCSFLKTKVEFLGFEVESGQIKPNRRKVEALTALPPPETVTQLRQFIGLASYFRQLIKDFSKIMAPLHRLTSLKGELNWKPEHEVIRQKVISVLSSDPILSIYDPELPVELHTDASSLGYGAILFQVKDNKRSVVAYYSKRTSPAESQYHSYDLETLAVVNSIKHFRQYLHGKKFTVFTDCNSLKSSQTKKELTPRAHRWWSFLQSFDFDVVYREGKRMSHVDFFSRNPLSLDSKAVDRVSPKRVDVTELSPNWLQAEQQCDAEISKIITDLEENRLDEQLAKTYVLRSDAFTKYVLLFHSTNIDSKSSIHAVTKSTALFGAPSRIIADQGRCFASKEFRDFCVSKNIDLHLIAAGSSRANGQVERVMSVLKSMLTAVETSGDKSWQDTISEVQLAINCTMNRVTKASPLELLIGKVARPLSLMCSEIETDVDLNEIRDRAAENITKGAEYDKARFDKTKAKIKNFAVGDFVLLENEERNQTKLDSKYKGPFKVIEVLDGDRYMLKALNSKRTYKYAHDRLRKMPAGHLPVDVDVDDSCNGIDE